MTRIAAREIAVQMVYTLDFSPDVNELLADRLDPDFYGRMADEDALFASAPDDAQLDYISRVVRGVSDHMTELDGYIERYAVGWKFGRLPRVSVAIMRVCMYELLYVHDIPVAASVNAAVEIAHKYEPDEMTAFINGILGSFSRAELGGRGVAAESEPPAPEAVESEAE